ncbi:MAG: Mini-ribonuclease 3 [Bacilli bacterium]|jgi:ribonuclease-3 family protein|nr:Mini-ribonuclease 3 [Acholeplasmataceae bacterium]
MASYEILNGANLAYIGDAYFELRIRKYLIDNKITKSNDLRKLSIKYVSAHAHQQIIDGIFDELTPEEKSIYNRGRNSASSSYRKNVVKSEYQTSSGFEAIIGFHYLMQNNERLEELIQMAINQVRLGEIDESKNNHLREKSSQRSNQSQKED